MLLIHHREDTFVDAKIQLRDVVKIFGRQPRGRPLEMLKEGASNGEVRDETGHVVGVSGVSLDIQQGEVFVVMGLSGSGKSTLIRCINRIHEVTDGEVLIDDEDITQVSVERLRQIRRQKTAMVFQHFALFPHKTVVENAGYGLKVQAVEPSERRERAMDALDLVGLAEWGDRYPHNLSGGMQQRVGLARALATDPDILLMDEAFSALDPLIRREMQNELLTLQQRVKKTIVFITHDFDEAIRLADRIAIMQDGAIIQTGTPEEVVTRPATPYVAEFTRDVPRAKVVSAGVLARAGTPGPVRVSAASRVGEVAMRVFDEDQPIGVEDADGALMGVLHRQDVLDILLGREPRA